MLAIYSIQILSLYFGPLESAHNVRFDVKSAYVEIEIMTLLQIHKVAKISISMKSHQEIKEVKWPKLLLCRSRTIAL